MEIFNRVLLVLSLLIISSPAFGDDPAGTPVPTVTNSIDNSDSFNDRLRFGDSNRTNTASFVDEVRIRIAKDNSVSTYAKRISIIPEGKKLVLRGPVLSSMEKLAIEKAAMEVLGSDRIRSELVVMR